MKVFAIKNDENQQTVAYLLYYETEKSFYIELPDEADPWEMPIFLSSFVEKNITTINSYWSKVWVEQRIVPYDRQNLGQILKMNNLEEYDEFKLLMLSNGRCSQDELYLEEISVDDIPSNIYKRFEKKIEDIVPLENYNLLVFFRNGVIKKCNVEVFFKSNKPLKTFLTLHKELFSNVDVQAGGYGVFWEDNLTISDAKLFDNGINIPLSSSDFKNFVLHMVINTAEAAELLECSRQNINDLVRRGKLHPVKITDKNTLFLKSEIMKRKCQ